MKKKNELPRTLIYKQTHLGDPSDAGHWGTKDCMGRVRDHEYDAVIGFGGFGDEPRGEQIAGKLTWIGVKPKRNEHSGNKLTSEERRRRGSVVTFEKFIQFGTTGRALDTYVPALSRRLRAKKSLRYLTSDTLSPEELKDVHKLLNLAAKAGPSAPLDSGSRNPRGTGKRSDKSRKSDCGSPDDNGC